MRDIYLSISSALVSFTSGFIALVTLNHLAAFVGITAGCFSIYFGWHNKRRDARIDAAIIKERIAEEKRINMEKELSSIKKLSHFNKN